MAGVVQAKASGHGPAECRFTEKMTAPKGRLTGAMEFGADLIIVQVPAETSNSVNLQTSQGK